MVVIWTTVIVSSNCHVIDVLHKVYYLVKGMSPLPNVIKLKQFVALSLKLSPVCLVKTDGHCVPSPIPCSRRSHRLFLAC